MSHACASASYVGHDMTHSKFVEAKPNVRHALKIVLANNGSWVNSCCACGGHSRSGTSSPNLASIGRSPIAAELSHFFQILRPCMEEKPTSRRCCLSQRTAQLVRAGLLNADAAIIVDLPGIVEKQRVPLRCRRPSCPDFGVLYWHNYSVREGHGL